jgi:hypothetical protein
MTQKKKKTKTKPKNDHNVRSIRICHPYPLHQI